MRMPQYLVILNYCVRGMVALVGVGILFIPSSMVNTDTTMLRTMGIVFVLFGVYRVASFYHQQNQQKREERFLQALERDEE